jgi:hypothetical protein
MQLAWNEGANLPATHRVVCVDLSSFATDVTMAMQDPALRTTGDGVRSAMVCGAERSR